MVSRTSPPKPIKPGWTLSQLQEECPGIELTLFSHFGIGSRERSGFSGSERLEDLLRRHLVFDAGRACERLSALAKEDWCHSLSCEEFESGFLKGQGAVIDVRGAQEYELCRLPGSKLLNGETVEEMRTQPDQLIAIVCRDGSQSPAASRLLRKQGFRAKHLVGGLEAWSNQCDPSFPILYPLQEKPGHWYLLADGRTLRFRRHTRLEDESYRVLAPRVLAEFSEGRLLLEAFPQIELVTTTPTCFGVRGDWQTLLPVVRHLEPNLLAAEVWHRHGQVSLEADELQTLRRTLTEEAPKILASHKGTVEIERYQNRELTLALGGGCAGCASANITTKRELAAGLYAAVPVLDSILSAE